MIERDALVSEHLGLASGLARRLSREIGAPASLDDDLEAAAREGLLDAASRFDVSRGVPFPLFASPRIRGAVMDALRKEGSLSRRAYGRVTGLEGACRVSDVMADDDPLQGSARELDQRLADHLATMATALALGLHAPTADDARDVEASVELDTTPEEQVARKQTREVLSRAVASLDEPGQTLVRRHYLGGERFDAVATDLGVSKSWASRLHARALQQLATVLGQREAHAW